MREREDVRSISAREEAVGDRAGRPRAGEAVSRDGRWSLPSSERNTAGSGLGGERRTDQQPATDQVYKTHFAGDWESASWRWTTIFPSVGRGASRTGTLARAVCFPPLPSQRTSSPSSLLRLFIEECQGCGRSTAKAGLLPHRFEVLRCPPLAVRHLRPFRPSLPFSCPTRRRPSAPHLACA
ncbi:hypothetical protein CALCODRAFT_61468 [Calocera cornea HHB12733]|uniref:Uncharacterized protein n=1 Tax=Calocera cornea HHB12733 TaxID=1353952 RepID=A0A165DMF4_9BASI|nr:hypothetical protein CALCODRAFT_61468 [Calocera cornea HHB12733]